PGPPPTTSTLAAISAISFLYEKRCRGFDQTLDALDEARRDVAVDDTMIERGRKVHHRARHELSALPHRPHGLLVDADDRHLRPVDHWRRHDAAQRPQARDRDGRSGELVACGSSLPRRLGQAAHLRSEIP